MISNKDFIIAFVLGVYTGIMIGWAISWTPPHLKYENKYDLPSEEVLESAIEKCQEGIPRNTVCKPKLTLEYARGVEMVTYFLNCMGPVHNRFYEETGVHWRCGRIDIHNDEPYGEEDSMPLIRAEGWGALGAWLRDLETGVTLYREELLKMLEEKTGIRIRYYKDFEESNL